MGGTSSSGLSTLIGRLKKGEAIIKNKLTDNYEIVTAKNGISYRKQRSRMIMK